LRRSVNSNDINIFSRLDMNYNQIRVIEANQNDTKFKCLGSGECCKIGLNIHMMECANIAFRLRQQYFLYLEDKGRSFADEWMESTISSLKEAMFDEDWEIGGETKRHCAFYKGGCTVYGFRPMVCRTFGTITNVDDYCPRIRNQYGSIDYFSGDGVKRIIQDFQNLLSEYVKDKPETYDMIVYMPLGVLSFLLSNEELEELSKTTDVKFWKAVDGWYNYRVQYTKDHGYDHEHLNQVAVSLGKKLLFPPE
jgi:Fe-S-cluster containining protein